MIRILIYSHIIPYPLDEGGKVAQFAILTELSKHAEVCFVSSGKEKVNTSFEKFKHAIPGIKAVWVTEDGEKQSDSIAKKYLGMVSWELTKYLNRSRKKNPIFENEYFIRPVKYFNELFVKQFLNVIETFQPDCFQVDFIDNASLAILLPKYIPSVLVLHDLRFATVRQSMNLQEDFDSSFKDYITNYIKVQELAYLNFFSKVITFSEEDGKRIETLIEPDKLSVLPFAVPINSFKLLPEPKGIYPDHLVFLGPDHHYPNYDALIWYSDALAQNILNEYGLRLKVIGKWQKSNIEKFSSERGIDFLGFVDDLSPILSNAIMVVPLRLGSGIRTKIIEAFAMGIPVISTSIGCEGLPVKHGETIYIANTPQEFLTAIDDLRNKSTAMHIIKNAQNLAKSHFSADIIAAKRLKIIQDVVKKS
jgi:glycosyltransferase involved in cell wall biosynthesis